MTTFNFSLDMERVQSSVQAAIRPAVEEALAAYDIKGAIARQLTLVRPKSRARERDYAISFVAAFDGYSEGDAGSLLDSLVRDSIRELAKEYVRSNIQMQRGEIEEAFRKMMNGSTNRLVKAFAGAVEDALKADWSFDLNVTVEHKTAERDDD